MCWLQCKNIVLTVMLFMLRNLQSLLLAKSEWFFFSYLSFYLSEDWPVIIALKNIHCKKEENYFDVNETFFTNDELPSLSVPLSLSLSLKCRIVQKVINDTIKEHLFGPDMTSTDENSPHSPESGEEGNS